MCSASILHIYECHHICITLSAVSHVFRWPGRASATISITLPVFGPPLCFLAGSAREIALGYPITAQHAPVT